MSPLMMACSRLADWMAWNSIWSGVKPSLAAISRAISMSKPE
jgi:hypothetical protein